MTSPRTIATNYAALLQVHLAETTKIGLKAVSRQDICLIPKPKTLLVVPDTGMACGVEYAVWNNNGPSQWGTPVSRTVR